MGKFNTFATGKSLILLIAILVLSATSCGKGGGNALEPNPPSVAVIDVEKQDYAAKVSLHYVGQGKSMKINGNPAPLSGTFVIERITENTPIVFEVGNGKETVTVTKTVECFTENETKLYKSLPENNGIWTPVHETINGIEVSPGTIGWKFHSKPTKMWLYLNAHQPSSPSTTNNDWSCTDSLRCAQNSYGATIPNDTTLVTRKVNDLGQLIVKTFKKR